MQAVRPLGRGYMILHHRSTGEKCYKSAWAFGNAGRVSLRVHGTASGAFEYGKAVMARYTDKVKVEMARLEREKELEQAESEKSIWEWLRLLPGRILK